MIDKIKEFLLDALGGMLVLVLVLIMSGLISLITSLVIAVCLSPWFGWDANAWPTVLKGLVGVVSLLWGASLTAAFFSQYTNRY